MYPRHPPDLSPPQNPSSFPTSRHTKEEPHVRFSEEYTYYEYTPPSSSASSPSSHTNSLTTDASRKLIDHDREDIVTVSSEDASFKSPQSYIPSRHMLSSSVLEDVEVHPSIALCSSGEAPQLYWVVLDAFSAAEYRNRAPPYTSGISTMVLEALLKQVATRPPSCSLTVRILDRRLTYPWRIDVAPGQTLTDVTVKDVLEAVYDNLHTPVQDAEFESMPERLRGVVLRVYHARLMRNDQSASLKLRVDCLGDNVLFGGLKIVSGGTKNSAGMLEKVELEMCLGRL